MDVNHMLLALSNTKEEYKMVEWKVTTKSKSSNPTRISATPCALC